MDLELEAARELSGRLLFRMLLGCQRVLAMPTVPVLSSCPAGLVHSFLHIAPTLPPSPGHSRSSTHLSHSGVGVTDLAQICLSTQKGGQLGLSQQVLQVVGSLDFQLG